MKHRNQIKLIISFLFLISKPLFAHPPTFILSLDFDQLAQIIKVEEDDSILLTKKGKTYGEIHVVGVKKTHPPCPKETNQKNCNKNELSVVDLEIGLTKKIKSSLSLIKNFEELKSGDLKSCKPLDGVFNISLVKIESWFSEMNVASKNFTPQATLRIDKYCKNDILPSLDLPRK